MISIGFGLYFLNNNNETINTIIAVIFIFTALKLNDETPKNAIIIIVDAADAMRPTELDRNPFNTFEMLSMSLCFLKNWYKTIEITKPDIILPKVATIAPGKPAMRIPTKEAVLTTKGPGVIWEIVIISVYSCMVSQLFKITTCSCINGIIAYPPPILNKPICKKLINRVKIILFTFDSSLSTFKISLDKTQNRAKNNNY